MTRINRIPLVMAAVMLCASVAVAGTEAPGTATVVPGSRYSANPVFRFFFGSQWRDAWTIPVEAPVLDLHTFDGGLRPLRRGGGLQTKNLRFGSGNGGTWVFRSIDKESARMLDAETRDSVLGDILQDLTSTAHPFAPLVVAPLLDAAGVLHATPELAVLPDDPALGEFRRDFAGVLGFLEKRIDETTPGVRKEEDTFSLFARLERRADERVDEREYLRARLVDILVGDWDRHVDQWRWVRTEERVWRPVPRDRDQAFSRFNGVIPGATEYYTKQLNTFGPEYPPIDKLTFSGRFTDRRFLVGLDRQTWEAVTADLVSKITDDVISDAVHRLPPALYAQGGAEIERALRSRRDALPKASADFYALLADRVDLHGTVGADSIEIDRKPDGAVQLKMYAGHAKGGPEGPRYERTFLPGETSEIRLYTMGGEDRVLQEGASEEAISLRVVEPSPGESAPKNLAEKKARYEPFRDWGSDLLFFPLVSYDSTRGFVPGARAQLTSYGFGRAPFAAQQNFAASWATALAEPRLEYSLDLRTRSPLRGLLYVSYSGMDSVSFYGLGNETVRDADLASSGYYDARQKRLTVAPAIEWPIAGPLRSRLGALLSHVDTERSGLVASGGETLASAEAGLSLDTRKGILTAERGVSLFVSGRHTPKLLGNDAAFTRLRAEASAVTGWHLLTDMVLDLRATGEKIWGTYPWFEAAFLGGAAQRSQLDTTFATGGHALRGYDLNRFAGDAAVATNAELRMALGKARAFLPLRYGLVALGDAGRVWVADESSSRWHTAYGGGLWVATVASGPTFQIASTMNATVVRSDERTSFYFSSGFGL